MPRTNFAPEQLGSHLRDAHNAKLRKIATGTPNPETVALEGLWMTFFREDRRSRNIPIRLAEATHADLWQIGVPEDLMEEVDSAKEGVALPVRAVGLSLYMDGSPYTRDEDLNIGLDPDKCGRDGDMYWVFARDGEQPVMVHNVYFEDAPETSVAATASIGALTLIEQRVGPDALYLLGPEECAEVLRLVQAAEANAQELLARPD